MVELPDNKIIKKESIKIIAYSSAAYIVLILLLIVVDYVIYKEIQIVNYSYLPWPIIAIVFFLISLGVAFILNSKVSEGKRVHKFFLYLFTIPVSIFIFSLVSCSGGLYSPFLSLYSLIFVGAIIITDSKFAIIFMFCLILLCLILHVILNTGIQIIKIQSESSGKYFLDFKTIVNTEIYQYKYASILLFSLMEMMLAELLSYLGKKQKVETN